MNIHFLEDKKCLRCFELGQSEPEHFPISKDHYQQIYFEVLDIAIRSITDRLDNPGSLSYSNIQQFISKDCRDENYGNELSTFCNFYGFTERTSGMVTLR